MIDFLDLSATTGLIATVALTLNILLGMLVSTAYKKHPVWKRLPVRFKRFSLFTLHNFTAYVALLFVLLHPAFLVLDKSSRFTLSDVLFPLHAPHQRLFVAMGTVALYAFIIVLITSQKWLRKKLSFRRWKLLHFLTYAAAPLFILHGVVLDPLLKDRPLDVFDGEKLISLFCGVLLSIAIILRLRYHSKMKKGKLAPR